MLTVPEATEKIIKRSRYLSEAISKNLINISSLAEYIKPELEEMLLKKVSKSSVIMAVRRISVNFKDKPKSKYKELFKSPPEMLIRSNLTLINLLNSNTLYKNCTQFFDNHPIQKRHFFTLSEGLSETTIVTSNALKDDLLNQLKKENIISTIGGLASITIELPEGAERQSGVIYFFAKSIAWEEINIVEIISTRLELTFVFDNNDINNAFSIFKSLFNQSIYFPKP